VHQTGRSEVICFILCNVLFIHHNTKDIFHEQNIAFVKKVLLDYEV